MQALLLNEKTDNPEGYSVDVVDLPKVGRDEMIVYVHYVGLNPVDYKTAEWGNPAWTFPHILGLDASGVVEEIGPTEFEHGLKVGDKVFYHGDLSKKGTFAQYAKVDVRTVKKVPEGISLELAAAVPCAGFTAYYCLDRKLMIQEGKTILINGAAGGVGSFAVVLAKLRGLRVFGTCSKRNFDYVKELGGIPIDYNENVKETVLKLNDGKLLNYVLEGVSAEAATANLGLLAFNGALCSIVGFPKLDTDIFFAKAPTVCAAGLGGHYLCREEDAVIDLGRLSGEMAKIMADNVLEFQKIPVKVINSLGEIPYALEEIRKRHVRGKIVAKVLME